jgi:hypothetical protein
VLSLVVKDITVEEVLEERKREIEVGKASWSRGGKKNDSNVQSRRRTERTI